jgi:hypothetical protein
MREREGQREDEEGGGSLLEGRKSQRARGAVGWPHTFFYVCLKTFLGKISSAARVWSCAKLHRVATASNDFHPAKEPHKYEYLSICSWHCLRGAFIRLSLSLFSFSRLCAPPAISPRSPSARLPDESTARAKGHRSYDSGARIVCLRTVYAVPLRFPDSPPFGSRLFHRVAVVVVIYLGAHLLGRSLLRW